jgi:stress response protein YsnF
VVEKPVETEITTREETVHVERRPVDRPVSAEDTAFQERVVEVTATGEEPVIAKEQRVVEEVAIGKDVTERQERVSDTVRRTEVEVEDEKTGKDRVPHKG